MKAMKKISTLFLALCLTISCFSLTAFAADGRISFSDPSTKVGDDVEVTCAVRSEGNSMDTVEVDIDYDTEYLKFRSGEGVTEGDTGELILNSSEGGTDVEFTLTFQALKEGSTSVTIESYRITGSDGDTMDFTMGNSAITIDEGDPSKIENEQPTEGENSGSSSTNDATMTVEIDGVQYTLSGDFPDSLIPTGYVRADVTIGGEEMPMLHSETSGAILGYLVSGSGVGEFFYYDQDADQFYPYAEVAISDSTTLLILSDTSAVNLPEVYKQAVLTIDSKDFPTWQDTSNDEGYYIIYGLASDGDKGYYRYDSRQGTYQRFEVDAEEDTEEEAVPEGILGQIEQFVQDHLLFCIFAAAIILIILLIILLVVGVKLHNRNSELDELYDEYGIDEEPEPEPVKVKKTTKKDQKKAKKAKAQKEFEDDYNENLYGGEDMDEEDFDEEDYDELEEEEFEDEGEYQEEILREEDLDDELDEDEFFDDEYDNSGEDPLDLSGNLAEEIDVEEEDDFGEDEDDDLDKTVALNSREQVKAARKAASARTGRSAKSAKSEKSAKPAQKSGSAKSSNSAKSTKTTRTVKSGQSGSGAAPAGKKSSAKTTQHKKAASKDVDADLEGVPEDEDIFAGYEKREELTLDDLWGEDGKKKKKRSHQEDDDDFKVDFVDLD